MAKITQKIKDFLFKIDCIVYPGCKMTGRDREEMNRRAEFVCNVMREQGLTPLSPVIEENVPKEPGKLINNDKERLAGFWKRDKHIIRRIAHVVWIDHGEMKSFGMEREFGLNRYCLWKPTVLVLPHGVALSVAEFEDDAIFSSAHAAAVHIKKNWGCRWNRWKWRAKMLNKSLPGWLMDQIFAWR